MVFYSPDITELLNRSHIALVRDEHIYKVAEVVRYLSHDLIVGGQPVLSLHFSVSRSLLCSYAIKLKLGIDELYHVG